MSWIEISVAVVVGVFLILIGDSVRRQRDRLWGPTRKARIEKARNLADDAAALTVWTLKEGLIVFWLGSFGILLSVGSVAFMVVDHIRGVALEGVAGFVFPLMLLAGTFIAYVALRGASQVIEVLESIETDDITQAESTEEPDIQPSD